jgi:hypothetical protein
MLVLTIHAAEPRRAPPSEAASQPDEEVRNQIWNTENTEAGPRAPRNRLCELGSDFGALRVKSDLDESNTQAKQGV